MEKIKCEVTEGTLLFPCIHCNLYITVQIKDLACKIFRHGHYNPTQQINPHASEAECQMLKNNPSIIGCCMPFRIIEDYVGDSANKNHIYYVEKCGFI